MEKQEDIPIFRFFISSPGDVDLERKTAKGLFERLKVEFEHRITITAYFWEYEPMRQQQTFQDQIPSTADYDAVICILWSRLGQPLTAPDGKKYASGTDYEVSSAAEALNQHGKPDLMVYWNRNPASIHHLDPTMREQELRQFLALEAFIQRNLVDQKTRIVRGAYTSYQNLGEFEDRLEHHIRALVESKLGALQGNSDNGAIAPARAFWRGNPYRGLQVFDFDHQSIFFGRTRAIGDVITRLEHRAAGLESARARAIRSKTEKIDASAATFVLICARSGAGKSSLARAGVLPLLTQPGSKAGLWRRVVFRPSDTPTGGDLFNALATQLTMKGGLSEILSGGVTLDELAYMLRHDPQGIEPLLKQALSQVANAVRAAEVVRLTEMIEKCRVAGRVGDISHFERLREEFRPPVARLAVLVDQMEELFTSERISADMRERFVQVLASLARSGWAWVIGTLRSDYFSHCAELELMVLKANDGFYDLNLPTSAEIIQMIRRPASAAGLSFEQHPQTGVDLAEALREETIGNAGSLPLLEFTLDRLFENQSNRQLTWAAYQEIGGLQGAIADTADKLLAQLESTQETFDFVMSNLVALGSGAPSRRVAKYEVLAATPQTQAFVDAFVAARLFNADKDAEGTPIISVAHEALFSRKTVPKDAGGEPSAPGPWLWTEMGRWLEENTAYLRARERIAVSLQVWQGAGKTTSDLLQQERQVLDGRMLLNQQSTALSPDERAYIKLSLEAVDSRNQRQRHVRRAVAGALILFAVGAGIGAWFGFQGERKAEKKNVELIAQTSEAHRQTSLANDARVSADEQKDRAEHERQRAQDQLREATLSAGSVAGNNFVRGNWAEAVAYLGRALHYDPANLHAGGLLWSAVVYGMSDRDALPQYVLTEGITSVAFSPDGTRFVTADADGNARQRDPATGRQVGNALSHQGCNHAAYSPDGKRIVTAGDDGDARQWNADDGAAVGAPLHHLGREGKATEVDEAVYSPDGKLILTVCQDGTVHQWDADSGKQIGQLVNQPMTVTDAEAAKGNLIRRQTMNYGGEPILHAAYSPDGTCIVTSGVDGNAQQWDAGTGQPVGDPNTYDERDNIDLERNAVRSSEYSPDGTRIVTVFGDGSLRQWDPDTGKTLGEPLLRGRDNCRFESAAYSPDGLRIVTACSNGTVEQWDADGNAMVGEPVRSAVVQKRVQHAVYSPDGMLILSVCEDGSAQQFAASSGLWMQGIPLVGTQRYPTHPTFSPDGKRVALICHGENSDPSYNTVGQWDTVKAWPVGTDFPQKGAACVAYSPDGKRVLIGGDDGTVQQWDADTGELVGKPFAHPHGVISVAYRPDASRIVTVTYDPEGTFRFVAFQWDVESGRQVGKKIDNGKDMNDQLAISRARYSADGRRLITTCKTDTETEWDAETGAQLGESKLARPTLDDNGLDRTSTDVAPDGERAVTTSPGPGKAGSIIHWDVRTGQNTAISNVQVDAGNAVYTPDGLRILSTGMDARLWEAPQTVPPVPPWIEEWTTVLSGFRFNESKATRYVSVAERVRMRDALRAKIPVAPPGTGAADPRAFTWELLLDWSLTPAAERPVTPHSALKIPDVAEHAYIAGTTDATSLSLGIWPALPLARLAFAKKESNETRADFLRKYDIEHLPAERWAILEAARLLRDQKEYQAALTVLGRLAKKEIDGSEEALRALTDCQINLAQPGTARDTCDKLLALPKTDANDFAVALALNSRLGRGAHTREILAAAGARFPRDPEVLLASGWALIHLKAPAEALKAFNDYRSTLGPDDEPESNYYAAMAAGLWLSGDKKGALENYQHLTALNPAFLSASSLKDASISDFQRTTFLAILAERQHRPATTKKPTR